MGCSVYMGDPPAAGACLGCEFDHIPGMLCREQRTALTTARARSETKRDFGQVAIRLRSVAEENHLTEKTREETRRRSGCDRKLQSEALRFGCILESKIKKMGNIQQSDDTKRNCPQNASLLPSDDSIVNYSFNSVVLSKKPCRSSVHRKLRNFSPKFSEVFVWICLFTMMQQTCTRAAPARPPSPSAALASSPTGETDQPKWINPCGMGANQEAMPQDIEMPYVSDQELLNQIVLQAKNALSDADNYKEDYVQKTFNVDFSGHQNSWKQSRYEWLPSKETIPKDLGEKVAADHLNKIETKLDSTLVDTYENLQKFAVGLEQVARDQRSNSGEFKDLFTKAEYKLRAVLCEIQVAMIERGVERRADVTRDIMADEFRNLDTSYRNLRDWLIFRDYMNALEYVVQVFEFFSAKLP